MIDFNKVIQDTKLDEVRYYLIVAGSRTFDLNGESRVQTSEGEIAIPNYDLLEGLLDRKLAPVIEKGFQIRIIHGDARGADKLASYYAENRGYWHKRFDANWDHNGKRAGMMRNQNMYVYASLKKNRASILFWDGSSKGTENNFLCGRQYNVKILCFNYILGRWLTSDEVTEIQDRLEEQQRYCGGY